MRATADHLGTTATSVARDVAALFATIVAGLVLGIALSGFSRWRS